MRRKNRKVAMLIWPLIAVTGIAASLLTKDAWQFSQGSTTTLIDVRSIVSTRHTPQPRLLDVEPPRHDAIDRLGESRQTTLHPRREEDATSPLNASQAGNAWGTVVEAPAAVSLHAPLLETKDELAGWEEPTRNAQRHTVATVAKAAQPVEPRAIAAIQRSDVGNQPQAWPATPVLRSMLRNLAQYPVAATWCNAVALELEALRALRAISAPHGEAMLTRLADLTREGLATAETLSDRETQTAWLRTAYSLQRRLAVWIPVWETSSQSHQRQTGAWQFTSTDRPFLVDTEEVRRRAENVARLCEQTGDAEAWRYYLLLHRVSDATQPLDPARRRITAQRLLSRLEWPGLTEPQRQWMQHPEIQDLAAAVRPWAAGPVDYRHLLQQIERQEADAIDLVSIDVAGTSQTLRFAAGPAPQAVATAIDTHYRNANLRFAVSQDFLNRLLPDVPDRTQPVQQEIMGTRITGTGIIASDVQIQLVPASDRWSLELRTNGQVSAHTKGRNGPVTVRNKSEATYQASTAINVTQEGVELSNSTAEARQQTYLRGIHTQYDGFPLIGSLVRGLAMSKYRDSAPQVKRISEARMERQIAAGIDAELETQIRTKSEQLTDQLLGPLARLRLDPTVVDLQTDETRLTARYRLAGDWQLAAFTPRPRAMSDSLLSVQVHQSAINNTFERLAPADAPVAIRTVATQVMAMFGQDAKRLPEDLPDDIRVQFSKTRPVTVELDGDRMWLTFRVVQLVGDGGLDLRHFIVRANYHGEVDGLRARLVRDGHLSIQGPRMSMGQRVAVRAVFNKVLSEKRPLPLTSDRLALHPATAGTHISQLEMRDGWLAFAIAPSRTNGTAPTSSEPADQAQLQVADQSPLENGVYRNTPRPR